MTGDRPLAALCPSPRDAFPMQTAILRWFKCERLYARHVESDYRWQTEKYLCNFATSMLYSCNTYEEIDTSFRIVTGGERPMYSLSEAIWKDPKTPFTDPETREWSNKKVAKLLIFQKQRYREQRCFWRSLCPCTHIMTFCICLSPVWSTKNWVHRETS